MQDKVTLPNCPVCGKDGDLWVLIDGKPCMACIKARHRAAMDGRCHCGRAKIPGEVKSVGGYAVLVDGKKVRRGGRSWIPCERCLGTIKQLT